MTTKQLINVILAIASLLFIVWLVRQLTKRQQGRDAGTGTRSDTFAERVIEREPVFVPYIVPVTQFGTCKGESNPDMPVFYRDGKAYCFERKEGRRCFYRECSVAPPPNTGTAEVTNPVTGSIMPSVPIITTVNT